MLQFEVRHWDHNPEGAIRADGGQDQYLYDQCCQYGREPLLRIRGLYGQAAGTAGRYSTELTREPGDSGKGHRQSLQGFRGCHQGRRSETGKGDIREGFYSCALIHLANISYRLGRSLDFDPGTMKFVNDAEADAMLTKEYRAPYQLPVLVLKNLQHLLVVG